MDNNLNPDEYYDLGYHPSPSSMETTRYSTLGDDLLQYGQTSSETSAFLNPTDENSCSNKPSSTLGWLPAKSVTHIEAVHTRLGMKQHTNVISKKPNDQGAVYSEMMKERLSKLLLGEDMSGSGKGVCTAVAISNAITNLYATVFGQNLRLEPLPPEKKFMWRREMDSLLSVCDYMVEFIPTSQIFQDGKTVEVMTSGPRSDISTNLPALQMLDTMLLEILESFQETEFCYVDQENLSSNMKHSGSFRKAIHRKAEKWWLPVPCVPRGGLSEKSKKQLQHKRDCTNQIHKAAMAINSSILAEMKVPDTYMAALPKSGKASVGDAIYRFMSTTDKFSSDDVLDCLNITSEHEALEIADRIEASMNTWRHKACMSHSKSSWDMIKDLMADGNKNYILVNRAENLLLCLKQRYPELPQTTLDACKIQYNRDVGQAILESYSRVLEGLAFNIVDRIDDVLYADKYVKQQD